MKNNRIWAIAGVLVIVVILAVGGLVGVKPQLDAASLSNSDRESVELINLAHEQELAQLREQSANIDALSAQVADLRRSIPASADLDTFMGELAALQTTTGVTVTNYTPTKAALFLPSAEVQPTVPASVMNNNFATISVAITVIGDRDSTLRFVGGLQSGNRLMLVSDISVAAPDDGITTTTITGLVYVLLDAPYVDPAADAAPAPTVDATAAE